MLTYKAANMILDNLCGNLYTALTGTVYIGLSTTAPSRDGTGFTEPSADNGYRRTFLGTHNQSTTQQMERAASGGIKNKQTIYFPEAVGDWGTCTHYLLFSGLTDGDLLAYGSLTSPIKPVSGTVPLIREGELQMTLS